VQDEALDERARPVVALSTAGPNVLWITMSDRPMLRLFTIPYSHYCEKARWALDHVGASYREEGHTPGLHRLTTLRYGKTTMPLLRTPEGIVTDSTDILHYLDRAAPRSRALFPRNPDARGEALELVELFDVELGPQARRFLYSEVLFRGALLPRLMHLGLGPLQRVAFRAMLPMLRVAIGTTYAVDATVGPAALAVIERVFARVGERLEGGRRFLAGDVFSAADLTFASLAALVLFPAEHPRQPTNLNVLPPVLRGTAERLRATPAGAFALRMYRDHRRAPACAEHADPGS
jgi:glutathione S-transferase